MKVINIFGGPGAGKSTIAAGLFHDMKIKGYNVELVTEYAKDMVWEERHSLFNDQLYIFAKQFRRLNRLLNHNVDFAITDSPIILSNVYSELLPTGVGQLTKLPDLVLEAYNKFDNINVFICRGKGYNPVGRNQTAEEAAKVDQQILNVLNGLSIPHIKLNQNESLVNTLQTLLEL